jgi:putative photosynthetic complex assembly protein
MSTLNTPHWSQQKQGLSRPMAWIGVVLLAVLVAVGLARWSGLDPRTPDAPVQWQRNLHFADSPGGDVTVQDADTRETVARFSGEQGFLRSTLRALARERHRENIGPQAPFVLVGRTDGRLTLLDPSTGQRIDLEAFGPSNAAVFASLRQARPATSSR